MLDDTSLDEILLLCWYHVMSHHEQAVDVSSTILNKQHHNILLDGIQGHLRVKGHAEK